MPGGMSPARTSSRICDRDAARLEAVGRDFGIARALCRCGRSSSRAEQLDFVDIATTVPSHRALVELAARHGVPVICQKPFAADDGRCPRHGRGLRGGRRAADGAREFPLADADPGGARPIDRRRQHRRAVLGPRLVPLGLRRLQRPALSRDRRALHHRGPRHPQPRHRPLPVRRRDAPSRRGRGGSIRRSAARTSRPCCSTTRAGITSVVDCSYATQLAVEPFPETLVEVDGDARHDPPRPGLSHGGDRPERLAREVDVSPALLPWASRPWHNIQESVLAIQRHWVDCLMSGPRAGYLGPRQSQDPGAGRSELPVGAGGKDRRRRLGPRGVAIGPAVSLRSGPGAHRGRRAVEVLNHRLLGRHRGRARRCGG